MRVVSDQSLASPKPVTSSARRVTTPTGDSRFVDAALDAVAPPPATWTFLDPSGDDLTGKPGLGGSAAATVVGAVRTFF